MAYSVWSEVAALRKQERRPELPVVIWQGTRCLVTHIYPDGRLFLCEERRNRWVIVQADEVEPSDC